ncbi:Arsenical resistance operon repressor [Dermatophilus congolensis]|uniref:Arsenical resistance operon repressor n=2 Tax=Dermatophilus congolensis TaxID=1863 RepID=A0A239VPV4_9MICO|nr:Arsenical resistance operon repressor [Dermatophilus congolensis]
MATTRALSGTSQTQQGEAFDDCGPDLPPMLVPRAEELAAVAKALSDPVRLRIFHHIAANSCSSVCACHLPEMFGVSQPTLSHHLKKLLEAGLIDKEMRGRWAHFTLRAEGLDTFREFLADLPL